MEPMAGRNYRSDNGSSMRSRHLIDQMNVKFGKILAQLEKPEDVKGHQQNVQIVSGFPLVSTGF
jgi:hypothetical protein